MGRGQRVSGVARTLSRPNHVLLQARRVPGTARLGRVDWLRQRRHLLRRRLHLGLWHHEEVPVLGYWPCGGTVGSAPSSTAITPHRAPGRSATARFKAAASDGVTGHVRVNDMVVPETNTTSFRLPGNGPRPQHPAVLRGTRLDSQSAAVTESLGAFARVRVRVRPA